MHTNSSVLYQVMFNAQSAILKIYKDKSDEANCAEVLKYYNGYGAVLPILYDKGAILLEFLSNDISLKQMVIAGKDVQVATIAVEVIEKLHSKSDRLLPKNLITIEQRFKPLYLKALEFNAQEIYIKAANLARDYLSQNYEAVVLHGDIHHDNIIHDKNKGFLAIDPKGIVGEKTYDIANLICNPYPLKEIVYDEQRILDLSKLYAKNLNLDSQRIIGFAFIHACLASIWAEEDGDDNKYWLNLAKILKSNICF
jgi:streptomycin 6-kinase